jgi:D-sedoheptulose 7-phosphate isomerase
MKSLLTGAEGSAVPESQVRRHLEQSIATKQRLIETGIPPIVAAAATLTEAFRNGRKLLICGNGGSAADAQHIAAEFVSVLRLDFPRPGLPAIALTTDTSFLTASANDFGFEGVFARQVTTLGQAGDVLIGISTSGNSKNVVAAFDAARAKAVKTIALTGESGGEIGKAADVAICVPSRVTQFIQESHIAISHILCEMVESAVFQRI